MEAGVDLGTPITSRKQKPSQHRPNQHGWIVEFLISLGQAKVSYGALLVWIIVVLSAIWWGIPMFFSWLGVKFLGPCIFLCTP